MFPERMRQILIGPSLVYPVVGAIPHITIDYTATSDSYSTFVTPTSRLEWRREAWATSGYLYAYQQPEGTTVQIHPQEHFPNTTSTRVGMEVYALASAAGNGGVRRMREEKDVGVKDSPSKRAKTVEEPPYSSPS